jgi:hypothetical protein
MNDFDSRWQKLARAARAGTPDSTDSPPFGFATRVVALRRQAAANDPAVSLLAMWQMLTMRALGVTLVLVILGVALNFLGGEDDSLSPPIADSMAEAFWLQ